MTCVIDFVYLSFTKLKKQLLKTDSIGVLLIKTLIYIKYNLISFKLKL